jgi:putative salt-induced outer membrane protein YdiY
MRGQVFLRGTAIRSVVVVMGTLVAAVRHVGAQQDTTKAAPAKSDTTKSDTTKAKPKGPPFAVVHADLGYVNTSGNTAVSTLNISDGVALHPSGKNEIDQSFSLVYGTSNNVVQTAIWDAQIHDTYKFTSHIGLFALGQFDRNTFAGIDSRFEEGGGVAVTAVGTPRDHLEFDVGASYIEESTTEESTAGVVTGVDSAGDYVALRTSGLYKHYLKKDTYVQEFLEGIPDLKTNADYRINSQTDLVAPLSRHLALKIGYAIHYANLPPPGFKTTDRLFTSDLQVTF